MSLNLSDGVLFHLIELPRHGDLSFGKGSKRRWGFDFKNFYTGSKQWKMSSNCENSVHDLHNLSSLLQSLSSFTLSKTIACNLESHLSTFRRVFTLEHLKANKLRYLHNGNEDIVDSFVFEMEIKGPDGLDLPLALTMRQRFLFEIRILPVNDPPRLTGAFVFLKLFFMFLWRHMVDVWAGFCHFWTCLSTGVSSGAMGSTSGRATWWIAS